MVLGRRNDDIWPKYIILYAKILGKSQKTFLLAQHIRKNELDMIFGKKSAVSRLGPVWNRLWSCTHDLCSKCIFLYLKTLEKAKTVFILGQNPGKISKMWFLPVIKRSAILALQDDPIWPLMQRHLKNLYNFNFKLCYNIIKSFLR